MPKNTLVVRAFQRERDIGVVPKTLGYIAILMYIHTTLMVETFLAHGSVSGGSNRLLVFTTEAILDILERYTIWHADGPFKRCPSIFYPVYTVHAVIKNCSIPMVYFLLL